MHKGLYWGYLFTGIGIGLIIGALVFIFVPQYFPGLEANLNQMIGIEQEQGEAEQEQKNPLEQTGKYTYLFKDGEENGQNQTPHQESEQNDILQASQPEAPDDSGVEQGGELKLDSSIDAENSNSEKVVEETTVDPTEATDSKQIQNEPEQSKQQESSGGVTSSDSETTGESTEIEQDDEMVTVAQETDQLENTGEAEETDLKDTKVNQEQVVQGATEPTQPVDSEVEPSPESETETQQTEVEQVDQEQEVVAEATETPDETNIQGSLQTEEPALVTDASDLATSEKITVDEPVNPEPEVITLEDLKVYLVEVKYGDTAKDVAKKVEQLGLAHRKDFLKLISLQRLERQLKVGKYYIKQGTSLVDLIEELTSN